MEENGFERKSRRGEGKKKNVGSYFFMCGYVNKNLCIQRNLTLHFSQFFLFPSPCCLSLYYFARV